MSEQYISRSGSLYDNEGVGVVSKLQHYQRNLSHLNILLDMNWGLNLVLVITSIASFAFYWLERRYQKGPPFINKVGSYKLFFTV